MPIIDAKELADSIVTMTVKHLTFVDMGRDCLRSALDPKDLWRQKYAHLFGEER
ncbi:hypothetical protein [Microbacterium protaetiae]|uniref:hypothetical protein n=1 Tax=Microbacterium protaetiae TaxID=2509458 RepID=UPI0013ED0890|nr:hypothetical protein [Microbacterium protaetiae]